MPKNSEKYVEVPRDRPNNSNKLYTSEVGGDYG